MSVFTYKDDFSLTFGNDVVITSVCVCVLLLLLLLFVLLFVLFVVCFPDKVLLHRSGCPGTHYIDGTGVRFTEIDFAFASQVVLLKVCATMPS